MNCTDACYHDNLRVFDAVFSNPNYSTLINPNTGMNEPLVVTVYFMLVKLLALSTSGTISIVGALQLSWRDPRLQWDPTKFNNVSVIEARASNIWTPNIMLFNGVSKNLRLTMNNDTIARIDYSGVALVSYTGQFDASCSLDLEKFPMDSPSCSFLFMGIDLGQFDNGLTFEAMAFTTFNGFVETSTGEFSLLDASISTGYLAQRVGSPCFNITLSYSRSSNYYYIKFVVPSILLLVAAAMAFLVPSSSKVKVTMSCSLVVALYVLQQGVASMLPATSTAPLLAIGMLISIGLGCFALISSVIVVTLRSLQPELGPYSLKLIALIERLSCGIGLPRRYKSRKVVPAPAPAPDATKARSKTISVQKDEAGGLSLSSKTTPHLSPADVIDRTPVSAFESGIDSESDTMKNDSLAAAIKLLVHTLQSEKEEISEKEYNWKLMDFTLNIFLMLCFISGFVSLWLIYFI